ncbi:Pyrrolo-quinoline quinone (modular protein) [Candidatus Sulfopaludibacter sp. SbA4]|nr:Pyrrolo-quinoline quinone (modular protein) [Candidatus Sulfopaludibacter sp. SbA4]
MTRLSIKLREPSGCRSTRLLTGLLCCFSYLLAQQDVPEAQKNPFAGNAEASNAGRKIYDAACQGCHGGEARGSDRAPALGGALAHGHADGEIFQNIRAGIRGTAMPPFGQFSTDQIWQVVSYIRSLATPGLTEMVSGNPDRGRRVFEVEAKCTDCHQVNGLGTPIGPDLSAAGALPAEQLRATILNPNQPGAGAGRGGAPGPGRGNGRGGRGGRGSGVRAVAITVRTLDGKEYRGIRRNEDVFSLQMVDLSGKLRLLDKSDLAEIRLETKSLMPDDYASRLTANDLLDLVAYLKTLHGFDPSKPPNPSSTGGVTYERIRGAEAEPQNWLTYWGDYSGRHFSSLAQINQANVARLQAQWTVPMPGDGIVESVPVVADGVMYTTGPPGEVFALDARTGRQIWKYQRTQKVVNPYESNRVNRGVAVLGNRIYFGTLDATLVALDARSGALVWETQVANTMEGYSITSAPLAVKDKIITGVAGGEYGIRGFIAAYDAGTGKRLWRLYTIPGPGEFGSGTWEGDSWKHGSAATWLTGTYDPDLNTLYWPVGNPGPDTNGDVRKGDNLFSCSVIALDPDTGQRKWHYQFTPNDTHDWDATEDVLLVDRVWRGERRKLLLQADRNGVFYVLDRITGAFLSAAPFVRTSWVSNWDSAGRPITTSDWRSTPEGSTVFPALGGGSNFQAPSYSPQTGWMYFAYHDGAGRYSSGPAPYEAGRQFWGRGSGGGFPGAGPGDVQGVEAFDPETGKVQWKFQLTQNSLSAGVLATAGGLVFVASREGNFLALDARSGKPLWHFGAGAEIASSPMSYAVDGRQYIAVSSAGALYSFALPVEAGNHAPARSADGIAARPK